MIQIINRPQQMVSKTTISGNRPQISLNSDGHLVVRIIDDNGDKLVVFDERASKEIIRFCQEVIAGRKRKDDSDIPF